MKRATIENLDNERGSTSILLTVIFASFLVLISILVTATLSVSGKSYADATLQLSGRSILSEFDLRLYDDYGLFGFKGEENEVNSKLTYYADSSFSKRSGSGGVELFNPELKGIAVNLKEFSLINVDLFEEQIIEAEKHGFLKSLLEESKPVQPDYTDRTLRNEVVIDNLPSAELSGTSSFNIDAILGGLPSISDLGGIGDSAITTSYLFNNFKHANGGGKDFESFFQNEIEYVIAGKMSDGGNYSSVRTTIRMLRIAQNTAHILSDPSKMKKIEAIIIALPPGANVVGAAAIVAIWAEREAQNDIELLEQGRSVPFIKTKASWALDDIEAIYNGTFGSKTVYPSVDTGQKYNDYLKLLLFFKSREEKLLRMMDIIQINLKGTYYRDFLLKEHYAGFRYEAEINDGIYSYTQRY